MDAGWSWMVMTAHFFILLIMVGYQKCNGIIFVEIQQRHNVTASMTSLVTGTGGACACVLSVLVMSFVLKVISERQCLLIGITLMTSGVVLSSLANSLPIFILTLGVLCGSGTPFIYGPSFVALSKYFSRRLTLAQAFVNSGVSVGGVVMPLLVRLALDKYFFPSGMLVIAGIVGQIFVCAFFFWPVPAKEKEFPTSAVIDSPGEENGNEKFVCDKRTNFENTKMSENGAPPSIVIKDVSGTEESSEQEETDRLLYSLPDIESALETGKVSNVDALKEAHRLRTSSEGAKGMNKLIARHQKPCAVATSLQNVHHPKHASLEGVRSSFLDKLSASDVLIFAGMPDSSCLSIPSLRGSVKNVRSTSVDSQLDRPHRMSRLGKGAVHPEKVDTDVEGLTDDKEERKRGCECFINLDFSACRSLLFWVMQLFFAFGFLTGVVGPAFLPPLAREKGLSDTQATHLLTVISGLDFFSRILPGVVAHYKLMTPHAMVSLTLIALGLLCQLVDLLDTFTTMMAFCVVFGCISGVYYSMSAAIVIEFMGMDRFPTALGFSQLFIGIASATTFPTVGALKDSTGSYAASYHFLGAMSLLAAIFLMSLPALKRRELAMEKLS